MTSNPLLAVIAVTVADLFGFVPTFRKAFQKPFEETIIEYEMSAFKWFISIFALGAISLTTVLYPVSLIITNGLFVAMVLVRRNQKVSEDSKVTKVSKEVNHDLSPPLKPL